MQMSVSYVTQAIRSCIQMTKILLPKVTQCKQKYMADKTQRKIRKFRFLFQVHL